MNSNHEFRAIAILIAFISIAHIPASVGEEVNQIRGSSRLMNLRLLANKYHNVCTILPEDSITCLWFKKRGNQIWGYYYYPYNYNEDGTITEPKIGICLRGVITDRQTIKGTAIRQLNSEPSPAEISQLPGQRLVNWMPKPGNKLKLAQAKYLGKLQVKYQVARLTLPSRTYYNSGRELSTPRADLVMSLPNTAEGWDAEPPSEFALSCI
jgi:hypothetical protein